MLQFETHRQAEVGALFTECDALPVHLHALISAALHLHDRLYRSHVQSSCADRYGVVVLCPYVSFVAPFEGPFIRAQLRKKAHYGL